MASDSSEQRREAARRDKAREEEAQDRRSEPALARNSRSAGQARQQPAGAHGRPFAPGEDGESH